MQGDTLTYPNGTVRKSLEPWLHDWIEFYHHQITGVRLLANRNSFILGDDMGLGKSLVAIVLFVIEVIRSDVSKLLIVCPVTLKENWLSEFAKFTTIPVTVLEGPPAKRSKLITDFAAAIGPRVLVINYEQVKGHIHELNRVRFDIKILDEAHYVKNHQSIRTKACHALVTPRSFLLTGTPLLNQVNELWSLFHIISPNKWPRYWNFVSRYCVFGGFKDKQIVGVKNERELKEYLSEYMLRRLAKDVLELKEPIPITRFVRLLPEQQQAYDKVLDDMWTDVESGEDVLIKNALVKTIRLKQIAATTATFKPGTDDSAILDVAIPDLEEITANGYRSVVFTQFIPMVDACLDRLHRAGIPTWEITGRTPQNQRVATVNDWSNSVKPGVIVCGIQVAKEGLNMTAGKYGLFLDRLFVPGLNEQAVRRLNRIGQDITNAITIIDYRAKTLDGKKTVHDRIDQILAAKIKLNEDIIEDAGDGSWKKEVADAMREALRAA